MKIFKQKVFEVVAKIPKGETMSYKEVAEAAGRPRAYRAVGNILNKNYNPKIPCHRVIRSNGKIGGYNRGIKQKFALLKKENWSKQVTEKSNALDLEQDVFTWNNPKKIALSLKKSAEMSNRRKATSFQSAMSMLNFYINRAGTNLNTDRKKILNQAKEELRKAFNKN